MSMGGNTANYGYNSFLGVAEETTFGTQVTASTYMEFNTESLKQNREVNILDSINTTRDHMRYLQGNETVEGSVEFDLNVAEDACIYILKQAMGGTVAVSTISAATSFQHTLNTGNMESNKGTSTASDVKSLTFTVQKGDTSTNQWHFVGNRVNNLTIMGEINSPVKATAELIGRTATNTSETHTIAFAAIDPLHFTGVSITTGLTSTTLSATSVIGFEFGLNNNLVNDNNSRELGSKLLKILPPTQREVSLKLTMRFDTVTAYSNFINETPISVKILMDSGVTIGGAGSSTYSMHIDMPKCYPMSQPMPEVGDKGILIQEIELKPMLDNTTTGYSVQMQVNNATADYF